MVYPPYGLNGLFQGDEHPLPRLLRRMALLYLFPRNTYDAVRVILRYEIEEQPMNECVEESQCHRRRPPTFVGEDGLRQVEL